MIRLTFYIKERASKTNITTTSHFYCRWLSVRGHSVVVFNHLPNPTQPGQPSVLSATNKLTGDGHTTSVETASSE